MVKTKHQQLFDILKDSFLHGKWPYGEKLPVLTSLAETYSVSINIASKAVDLLKKAGMVETKVGDGIYSTFKLSTELNSFHYAGDRVYGHYRGAKPLRILVEDSKKHQIQFWNNFFQDFSTHNPDIEIDVSYQFWNNEKKQTPYEAVFGGYSFLKKMVPPEDHGLSQEWVDSFMPELYEECVFNGSDFSCKLPYGFSAQQILADSGTPKPKPLENILDYLERLPAKKAGYFVWSSRLLLASMGIDMAKIGTDDFTADDKERMLSVFQQARKLYRAGRMIWPHGKVVDYDQMYDLLKNHGIQAFGIPSNINRYTGKSDICLLPYPHGTTPYIQMHYMHISEHTLYPEEYLRLIQALLSRKTQKKAEEGHVFMSILRDFSAPESDELRKRILEGKIQFQDNGSEVRTEAFYNFLGWEFYYYLEGRRESEVIEIINKKIRYYYAHVNTNKKENDK